MGVVITHSEVKVTALTVREVPVGCDSLESDRDRIDRWHHEGNGPVTGGL
jgi:hypothetical protein